MTTFAAADEAMALGERLGDAVSPGAIGAEMGAAFSDFSGMTMTSPHVGQGISEPAPSASTDNSCSQCGQLKMISISGYGFFCVSTLALRHDENQKNRKLKNGRGGEI